MSAKFAKDWWRRTEENDYSYYNPNKRLFDWDTGRSSGYSSYFIRDTDNLKNAAKMISSMFKVIGVPKAFKYEQNIKPKRSSEDVTIPVPISMLKDESGNYVEKDLDLLDAFYGAAIQNAALATMQTKAEYARTMTARSTETPTTPQDLLYSVLNTERIDKKLSDRFPGYSRFVQKFKNYKYNKTYEPLPETEHPGKRLLETLVKFLRYPTDIRDSDLEEFKEPLEQIEHYVKKNGFPVSGYDCEKQASYMYSVVEKFIEDSKDDSGDGDGDGDSGEGMPGGGGKGSSPSKDEMNDFARSLMEQLMNPSEEEETEESLAEFSDFTDEMEQDNNAMKSKYNYDVEGENGRHQVVFKNSDSNKEKYKKCLSNIDMCKATVLAKLFARKCKDYQFSMKSMRSGRLDTNKIAEAKQHVPTIYERMGEVKTNKINIAILIDESGSMGGDKIAKAREASIFLNEVFKNLPDVRLYIYGHTADEEYKYGITTIRVYREHGKNSDMYSLGSVRARHNNKDGDAIYHTARRVRMQNEDPCILFVISDGAPHASDYHGQAAIEDTRKKVKMAENLGFQVIQIAIENHVPSAEMFTHYIKMTDMKTFPTDLANYVSNKVDKMIKTKVTL